MSDAKTAPEPISEADVRRVARLARLDLTDAEIADQTVRLAAVLGYIDRLRALDLAGVEPLSNPLDATDRACADQPGPCLETDALMKRAPETFPPFVKVPKVLGDRGSA